MLSLASCDEEYVQFQMVLTAKIIGLHLSSSTCPLQYNCTCFNSCYTVNNFLHVKISNWGNKHERDSVSHLRSNMMLDQKLSTTLLNTHDQFFTICDLNTLHHRQHLCVIVRQNKQHINKMP